MIRILAALILLAAAPAAGQRQAPKKDPNEVKAAAHYRQGRAYFKAEVFDKALEEYQSAYALSPKPLLLYHIGQAHEKLGDKAIALEDYKQFLEADPENQFADDARTRVALLTRELKKKEDEAKAATPAPAATPARTPGPTAAPPARPPAVTQDPAPPAVTPAYADTSAGYRQEDPRAKWIWIGGGAAALGAGLALDLIPDSGDNYELEAVDFIPVVLYGAGLAAITIGVLK